jgi:hypothetical protein
MGYLRRSAPLTQGRIIMLAIDRASLEKEAAHLIVERLEERT